MHTAWKAKRLKPFTIPVPRIIAVALTASCVVLFPLGAEEVGGDPLGANSGREVETRARSKDTADLLKLTLEQLMDLEVISVMRTKGQTRFRTPAAVHVVSPEEIRRSGHRHMAEMLRLVPGLHIARVDAAKWAVTARGMNFRFNRLQMVQKDGRILFSPAFAGVIWEGQDTPVDDIERIEVIRGPGASLWGANTVNGVINFETKSAKKTQGLSLRGGGGTEERGFATLRYGGKATDDIYYRFYGKYLHHDHFRTYGADYTDDWDRFQGGFRFDWDGPGPDKVTWQGDVYHTRAGHSVIRPDIAAGTDLNEAGNSSFRGANFLTRWTHTFSEDNEIQLRFYYDVNDAHVYENVVDVSARADAWDLDFQHNIAVGKRHRIVWGVNGRTVDLDTRSEGPLISFEPTGRLSHAVSAFFQDTVSAIPDTLEFTFGSKAGYNEFSNFEVQPSVRMLFLPHRRHALWGAVSYGVRVPTDSEFDVRIQNAVAPGVAAMFVGNKGLNPEEVWAFEGGYRTRPLDWFSLDLAVFHNRYENLLSRNLIRPFPPLLQFGNDQDGDSYGAELAAHWQVRDNLRISAHYSWLRMRLDGPQGLTGQGNSPQNQFHMRSFWDITPDLELNAAVYYYDNSPNQDVKAFWRGDVGVTWRPPVKNLELSVWGTNLFDDSHREFGPDHFLGHDAAEVERGVFMEIGWRF